MSWRQPPAELGPALAALESWPDAAVVVGADGEVFGANRPFSHLCGRPVAALVGTELWSILDLRDASGERLGSFAQLAALRLRSVKRIPEQRLRLRRGDGRHIEAFATAALARDDEGALVGLIVSLRRPRTAPSKSGMRVVSAVGHELRSPLTSLKGYTTLMLKAWERLDDGQKRDMISQMRRDGDRVARIIGELVHVARLETGTLALNRQRVQLADLAVVAVATVREDYPALEVDVQLYPDPFPAVLLDEAKVGDVLRNLLENACKYGSGKDVEIRAELREGSAGAQAVLSVSDRGPGLVSGEEARIFDKLFRSAAARPTGSGLGLWIARGIAEAHGGHLGVHRREGGGTTFTLSLPIDPLESTT